MLQNLIKYATLTYVLFFRGRGMPPRGGGPPGGAPRGGPGRGASSRGGSAQRGGHPSAGPTRGGASTRSRPPSSAQRMTPAPALSHQQQHHQHPQKPEGYPEYVSPHLQIWTYAALLLFIVLFYKTCFDFF